jgi:hypothetical protein
VEPDDIADCVKKSENLKFFIDNLDYFTEMDLLDEFPISISDIPDVVIKLSSEADFPVDFLLLLITEDPSTMGKICSTDDADLDTLLELLKDIAPPENRGIGLDTDCDNYDQPSNEGICYDPSHGDVTGIVRGQDYAGGVSAYDDDLFIKHVLSFQDEYGWEYDAPFVQYVLNLAANYNWPKNVPLPILGNPLVTGIITGQLYDPATPYIWTSEMRDHFPFTSSLTSQSIFHSILKSSWLGFTVVDTPAEGPCQKYVVKYLETGVINWTDGTVCGEQVPYFGGEIRN